MAREKLESIQKQIQLNTGKGDMCKAEENFYKMKARGQWLSLVH